MPSTARSVKKATIFIGRSFDLPLTAERGKSEGSSGLGWRFSQRNPETASAERSSAG